MISDPANPHRGFRVPIRSVILGRRFAYSGTQHDLPLRLFRRDCGRWVGLVHETVELDGRFRHASECARASIRFRTSRCFWTSSTTTRRWKPGALAGARRRFRTSDVTLRPLWTFFKLYVFKQGFRDGVEGFMFCAFPAFRWRSGRGSIAS